LRTIIGISLVCVIALTAVIIGGCGNPDAKQTAEAFVKAMVAKDTAKAASYWDYNGLGREKNSDWDTFGVSQRNLIIKESKWAENRAEQLDYWKLHFSRTTKVGDVVEMGDTAEAEIIDGRAQKIQLVRYDDKWYVSELR
jgi:hypothetical protein